VNSSSNIETSRAPAAPLRHVRVALRSDSRSGEPNITATAPIDERAPA